MKKYSRAEAGRLGGQKFALISAELKAKKIAEYNISPNLCICCNKKLPWESKQNKFCTRSCSATYNNIKKSVSSKINWECAYCGKSQVSNKHTSRKYCNHSCRANHQKDDLVEKVKSGIIFDRGAIRKVLFRINGRKCYECKLTEWIGNPIPIEVDHIDGNAGNNSFDNLRLLCPNCHAITDTWKGRNKGNGRAARGLPLR